jgi:hypothetical protein
MRARLGQSLGAAVIETGRRSVSARDLVYPVGMTLPPGQYAIDRLPRFGMSQFARRFPRDAGRISLAIAGEAGQSISLEHELDGLPASSWLPIFTA